MNNIRNNIRNETPVPFGNSKIQSLLKCIFVQVVLVCWVIHSAHNLKIPKHDILIYRYASLNFEQNCVLDYS